MKRSKKDSAKNTNETIAKIKKLALNLCQWFDNMLHKQTGSSGFFVSLCCFVMVCMLGPIISPTEYFQDIWLTILGEVFYALFVFFFLVCTIIFHRKSICHWIANVFFILRYVTLIDLSAEWNRQFSIYFLSLLTIYFCLWGSWISAKDINKKGGKFDTICLALGLTLLALGIILKNGEFQYYKTLIVVGVALIYLYAISRAILRVFFSKDVIKIDLFMTMIYVVIYVIMIVGMPFFLSYAGVQDGIIKEIIIPIYAAAIGGILTLAGVAWTIKNASKQRKDEERKKLQPLFTCKYVDWGDSKYRLKTIDQVQFNNVEDVIGESRYTIMNVGLENTGKTEFFLCGIYINGKLVETKVKELIRKEQIIRFANLPINIDDAKINEIKLYIEDLIENHYTMQLEFSISNHIVIIKDHKSLQLVEKTNE